MDFRFDLIVNSFPLLLIGAGVTVQITLMSVMVGVLIGLFVGIARISSFKILRFVAAVYVDFFRGTPLLVQIFLIYFAIPAITGQRMDPFIAAISACGINSGAYVAEIFLPVDGRRVDNLRADNFGNGRVHVEFPVRRHGEL